MCFVCGIVFVDIKIKIDLNNKRAGAFSQLENGAQHIRQVSFRIKKKTISKKMARSQWHGAADKVRVRMKEKKALF